MSEKNLQIGFLLDFYGDILSERKRTVMDMYYNEDFSLAEIAAEIGISRQGARDIIKKSEEELLFYEEKLGLAKKFERAQRHASRALTLCEDGADPKDIEDEIRLLLDSVG